MLSSLHCSSIFSIKSKARFTYLKLCFMVPASFFNISCDLLMLKYNLTSFRRWNTLRQGRCRAQRRFRHRYLCSPSPHQVRCQCPHQARYQCRHNNLSPLASLRLLYHAAEQRFEMSSEDMLCLKRSLKETFGLLVISTQVTSSNMSKVPYIRHNS